MVFCSIPVHFFISQVAHLQTLFHLLADFESHFVDKSSSMSSSSVLISLYQLALASSAWSKFSGGKLSNQKLFCIPALTCFAAALKSCCLRETHEGSMQTVLHFSIQNFLSKFAHLSKFVCALGFWLLWLGFFFGCFFNSYFKLCWPTQMELWGWLYITPR